DTRQCMKAFLRRKGIDLLGRLPSAHLLRIIPAFDGKNRYEWVFDTEWWDLAVEPVPEMFLDLPLKTGVRHVFFVGTVIDYKGVGFFLSAAEAAAEKNANLQFLVVGDASRLSERERLNFLRCGGVL